MKKYVKPNATIRRDDPDVAPRTVRPVVHWDDLAEAAQTAIAGLKPVTWRGVLKALVSRGVRISPANAKRLLTEAHRAGQLKLKSERYAELYPTLDDQRY